MVRQFSLREKFAVDVSDEEDQLFFLAVVLAIEAIHEERNGQEHRGGIPGLSGGIGGLLGGTGL